MALNRFSIIAGSGSYVPPRRIPNDFFSNHVFYGPDGAKFKNSNQHIIRKFQEITGIDERRYVTDDLVASKIAFYAARNALENAGIDGETLDYIIVAHNFGDIKADNKRTDLVPALASRVKHYLGIKNPHTIPYDLPFGCAGWLQGMIQANYYIQSGDADRVLIIGAETLSRITDPHDRDSMIYADGAGAVILEAVTSDEQIGILSHYTESYANEQAFVLRMGGSYDADEPGNELFLKMQGRKVYELALRAVPSVMKQSMEKAHIKIDEVRKILIHQANLKMDEAIVQQFYKLCGIEKAPAGIMPMTISTLGNTSVATLPTLYDLIMQDKLDGHEINPGDILIFASVGAGINMNAAVYKVPG